LKASSFHYPASSSPSSVVNDRSSLVVKKAAANLSLTMVYQKINGSCIEIGPFSTVLIVFPFEFKDRHAFSRMLQQKKINQKDAMSLK